MKPHHLDDESLTRLLRRDWTASPQSTPGFRSAVWARIEAGRRMPVSWNDWLRVNGRRVAACAAASIIVAGAGGGWFAANVAHRERDQLIRRYVVSIDPHQQMGSRPAP